MAFILFVTVLTFSRGFLAEYVNWDDPIFLKDNIFLKVPFGDAFGAFFFHFFFGDYLPIPLISYWFETNIFGFNPGITHGINLGIHLINIVLVFKFLSALGIKKATKQIITFVFAVHPVQVEPLMWVSNRNLLLCTCFVLTTCLLAQKKNRSSVAISFVYILGFLCKATGILLPFLLVAIEIILKKENTRSSFKKYAPLFIIGFMASFLRIWAYAVGTGEDFNSVTFGFNRILSLPIAILNAVTLYLRLIFNPFEHCILYDHFKLGLLSILGALLCLGVMGFLAYSWRKSRNPEIIFFSVFILVFLLPVLQILPRNNYVNDRYLYLPLVGFAGLLALLVNRENRLVRMGGGFLLLIMPFFSFYNSSMWLTDLDLWQSTVQMNPKSVLAHNNLGLAYYVGHDDERAIEEYKAAVALNNPDGLALAYGNLGNIYNTADSKFYNIQLAKAAYENGLKVAFRMDDTFRFLYSLAKLDYALNDKDSSLQRLTELKRRLASVTDGRFQEIKNLTDKLLQQIAEH